MNFDLSDEQRLLRDTVRDFARNEVGPRAEELDRTTSFPYELVAKMGELGIMGIPFPTEYGGGGADTLSYAIAVEELARIDSSVSASRRAVVRVAPASEPPSGSVRPNAPRISPEHSRGSHSAFCSSVPQR